MCDARGRRRHWPASRHSVFSFPHSLLLAATTITGPPVPPPPQAEECILHRHVARNRPSHRLIVASTRGIGAWGIRPMLKQAGGNEVDRGRAARGSAAALDEDAACPPLSRPDTSSNPSRRAARWIHQRRAAPSLRPDVGATNARPRSHLAPTLGATTAVEPQHVDYRNRCCRHGREHHQGEREEKERRGRRGQRPATTFLAAARASGGRSGGSEGQEATPEGWRRRASGFARVAPEGSGRSGRRERLIQLFFLNHPNHIYSPLSRARYLCTMAMISTPKFDIDHPGNTRLALRFVQLIQ